MTNPMYLTLNPVPEAMETILRTMHEAEEGGQHTPGAWMKEGALHHLRHALDHVEAAEWGAQEDTAAKMNWLDVEHALTRLAMALWCHKRNLDGDYGTEGAEAAE
jgi:hypothetical protein